MAATPTRASMDEVSRPIRALRESAPHAAGSALEEPARTPDRVSRGASAGAWPAHA